MKARITTVQWRIMARLLPLLVLLFVVTLAWLGTHLTRLLYANALEVAKRSNLAVVNAVQASMTSDAGHRGWTRVPDEIARDPMTQIDVVNTRGKVVYSSRRSRIGNRIERSSWMCAQCHAGGSARATTDLVLEALKMSGQRGVLATGWSGMSRDLELPENIFMLESAPHSWLFPRMAAVVHHGGAGTTAAGFRAGVPGVIIPFSNDQFAWGRRAWELGVGAKPIPRKKLTSEKLADAIRFALKDQVKNAAKVLGEKIQNENGAEKAAKVILECMS